ncbi:hypothetical protein CJ178_31630 [Rhodococcus sp. ACPA4]|nr:hypothetical protein CJ178_31630 [Rhodococcus sp. ACPA4]
MPTHIELMEMMLVRIDFVDFVLANRLQKAYMYGYVDRIALRYLTNRIVRLCDFRASMSRTAMSRQIPVSSFEDSRT